MSTADDNLHVLNPDLLITFLLINTKHGYHYNDSQISLIIIFIKLKTI